MKYEFEEFQPRQEHSRAVVNGNTVTITNKGILSLSRCAHHYLGTPDYVVLLWDARARVVGIRSSNKHNSNALWVSRSSRSISATAFCHTYAIPIAVTQRYPAFIIDEHTIGFEPES